MIRALAKNVLMSLLRILPWRAQDVVLYAAKLRRFPRISKPMYLNDHVMRRKWTECHANPIYAMLADKVLVRDYVKDAIGSGYLLPLIHVTEDPRELASWLLGRTSVVVKPNHGAGMVRVVNSPLSESETSSLSETAAKWLSKDFSNVAREAHYARIPRKIIVEQRIGNGNAPPDDFKLHVFRGGEFAAFVLQIVEERSERGLTRTFYDNQFEVPTSGARILSEDEARLCKTALDLSYRLLGDMHYARVDWYIDNGYLWFGEITLTPAAGLGTGYASLDLVMGEYWNMAQLESSEK